MTTCRKCHRPLTDPTSVAIGMGPTCRGTTRHKRVRHDNMTADIFGKKARATFSFDIIDGVVVIYDLDIGCSVTNDAENVIAEVAHNVKDLRFFRVIYRDTDGIFDGMLVDEDNRFAGFYPIRATDLPTAFRNIREHSEGGLI